MNYLTIAIMIFSVLGALDFIFGNRFGLGAEFKKAFMLLGTMALSMIGMIVISPLIADIANPLSVFLSKTLHIDSSLIPASLFANDMGGASLAVEMAQNRAIGRYNALVVSSMMGCTISFTIPFALGVVSKNQHKDVLLGLLCGIVAIPAGCFVSGLLCSISLGALLINLIPLVIFSISIALGLFYFPDFCIKLFKGFGVFITALITLGLALGIVNFLSGAEIIKGIATVEEGADICVNAAVVLSGSFPLMYVISKLLSKPLKKIGNRINVNEISVVGVISSLASCATAYGMMDKMDRKGVVMNSAFSVSGAFALGSHLAFTLAFDSTYLWPVIIGKLVSGALAVIVSCLIFKRVNTCK